MLTKKYFAGYYFGVFLHSDLSLKTDLMLMFYNLAPLFPAKRPKQTVQTQIRLLLQYQSDQGLPSLLF